MPGIEINGVRHPSVFTEPTDTSADPKDPSVTLMVRRLDHVGLMDSSLYLEFAYEGFGDSSVTALSDYADQLMAPHPAGGQYVDVVAAYDHQDNKVLLTLATATGERLYTWELSRYGYGEL